LREFNALVERYAEEQDWLNYRAAMVASVIASGLSGKEFQPKDFMPQKQSEPQTPDQIYQQLKIFSVLLGGTMEKVDG